MARKRKPLPENDGELNLVPIMNLVVCLIPIVLLGTSLVKVGVIEIEPPRICAHCAQPDEGPPLGLSLTVGADGFELRADDRTTLLTALIDLLDPTVAEPEFAAIPRQDGALDFVGLYNALVLLKAERPDVTQMAVNAAPGVPWREVVATLDLARHRLAEDHYADRAALAIAPTRGGPPSETLLFPTTMLTVAAR